MMVIIETSIFTKRIKTIMPDEEYRMFQQHLANQPNAGKVIVGSGGLRKIRWSVKGQGKRGGSRIIYYWFRSRGVLLLLFVYSKQERDDLTHEQLLQLRRIIEMEYR